MNTIKERCDTCGAYLNVVGCLNCGAPVCCPQCCRITRLTDERDLWKAKATASMNVGADWLKTYEKLQDECDELKAKLAEANKENERLSAVLPEPGDVAWKTRAVLSESEEKRLRSELGDLRERAEKAENEIRSLRDNYRIMIERDAEILKIRAELEKTNKENRRLKLMYEPEDTK